MAQHPQRSVRPIQADDLRKIFANDNRLIAQQQREQLDETYRFIGKLLSGSLLLLAAAAITLWLAVGHS